MNSEIGSSKAAAKEKGFIGRVDAQTGIEKTYQVFEPQLENLINDSKKKLIYATNLRVKHDIDSIRSEIKLLEPYLKDAKELSENKVLSESAQDLVGVYCDFFEYVKTVDCIN